MISPNNNIIPSESYDEGATNPEAASQQLMVMPSVADMFVSIEGTQCKVVHGGICFNHNNQEKCRFKNRAKCTVASTRNSRAPASEEDSVQLLFCSAPSCSKVFHFPCFQSMVVNEKDGAYPRGVEPNEIMAVCGKQCHGAVMRNAEIQLEGQQDSSKFWDKDGRDGGPSSQVILLNWITTEENCDKYFGMKTNDKTHYSIEDGESKRDICKKIAHLILQQTGSNRTADSVRAKIDDMAAKFKETYEWIHNTGQGVLASEGESSFRDVVLNKFRYYYDLEPVLSQRPTTRPVLDSDRMDKNPSYDEDDSSSEDNDDDDFSSLNTSALTDFTNDHNGGTGAQTNDTANDNNSIATGTSSGKRKGTAMQALTEFKKVKGTTKERKSSGRGNHIILEGANDGNLASYLEKKTERESKLLYAESRRVAVEEERLKLDKQKYEDAREVMIEENKLKAARNTLEMAKMNFELLSLRSKAKEDHPEMSDADINALFPLLN